MPLSHTVQLYYQLCTYMERNYMHTADTLSHALLDSAVDVLRLEWFV